MKRIIPLFVATLTSFFVLAGLIWPVSLGGYLNIVLDWAIIVGAMALLVAIAHLFWHSGTKSPEETAAHLQPGICHCFSAQSRRWSGHGCG